MPTDDISAGLEANRYLKTVRLMETFEDDVVDQLEEILDDITTDRDDLFDHNEGLSKGIYRNPGATYGTIRLAATFTTTDDEENALTLNSGIEWVEPEAQHVDDWSDPLLCYVYYKMKYASDVAYERVAETTEESDAWSAIRCGDEQWDSGDRVAPGIFYVPVRGAEDVEDGLRVLADHFFAFADQLVG